VEWTALDAPAARLLVRGGYFYDPSPVPGQTGVTNYLDTDRHVVSASPGVVVLRAGNYVLPLPIHIDMAFQYQHLVERIAHKAPDVAPSNPGYPKVGVSGSLFSLSLMIGTEFDVK
jgi:long-chain fatty acid transport protein